VNSEWGMGKIGIRYWAIRYRKRCVVLKYVYRYTIKRKEFQDEKDL